MYDAEEPVLDTLVCENEVMKGVLDAFGMDIKVKRVESVDSLKKVAENSAAKDAQPGKVIPADFYPIIAKYNNDP